MTIATASAPHLTKRAATLIGFVAVLMWSFVAVLTIATGMMPPFQLAAMTFAVGGTIGPLSWLVRPSAIRSLRQPPGVWVLGIGSLFSYHALYFSALRLAPPVEASLINYLWPLLIVLFSIFLPSERLRAAPIIGALLGFSGLLVLFSGRPGHGVEASHALGYLCAGISAFIWAGYSVLSRRHGTVPTDTVAVFCLATAALSLLCHLAFEATVWPDTAEQWLALTVLGAGPAGGAFYLWDVGIKQGDIRLLGVGSYAAPALSTVFLILIGYAEPTPALALACALIVAGALMARLV